MIQQSIESGGKHPQKVKFLVSHGNGGACPVGHGEGFAMYRECQKPRLNGDKCMPVIPSPWETEAGESQDQSLPRLYRERVQGKQSSEVESRHTYAKPWAQSTVKPGGVAARGQKVGE